MGDILLIFWIYFFLRMAASNAGNSSQIRSDDVRQPSQKHDTSSIFKEFGGFIQNNGKPFEVILRNKKPTTTKRNTKIHERLSFPNLNDLTNSENSKEDDERFGGKNAETGELSTINEGLITPIFRRKNYGLQKIQNTKAVPVQESAPMVVKESDYTSSQYLENNLNKNDDSKK